MPSREVPVTEGVYERLDAYRRDGESFSEALERLLGHADGDWRTRFGFLDDETGREFAEIVENESREDR